MEISKLTDGQCLRVPLSLLRDAPWGNVRKEPRDETEYDRLKGSIGQTGVTQPITVRPSDDETVLEVLAGYGRWDASLELGLDDIPVLVKRVGDKDGMAIGLNENLMRDDLNVVDEIRTCQQFVSLADGNYAEAATALGWDERKVRSRLKLNDCCEAVLQALAKGSIKFGHAEVLCQFSEKLQSGTLKKIIDEGWSVDHLKERAGKAVRHLRYAAFDTKDCQSCPHNSSVQAQLFDNHIGAEKCSHLPCFRQKTEQALDEKRKVLEAEHGTVLLAIEKPPCDRKTVSAKVVGKAAYTSDCLNCEKRIHVLQDGIERNAGQVIADQCIDLACFRTMVEANTTSATKKKPTKKTAKRSKKPTSASKSKAATLPARVVDQARELAREVLSARLLATETFRLAVLLHAVAKETGYTIQDKTLKPHTATSERIKALAGWDKAALEDAIAEATAYGLKDTASTARFNGIEIAIASSKHVPTAKDDVIAAWTPTKERLEAYRIGGLESLCRQDGCGFAAAYDSANGQGAFDKLMKKRKAQIIEAIVGFEFDWSAVAPAELTALVAAPSR